MRNGQVKAEKTKYRRKSREHIVSPARKNVKTGGVYLGLEWKSVSYFINRKVMKDIELFTIRMKKNIKT